MPPKDEQEEEKQAWDRYGSSNDSDDEMILEDSNIGDCNRRIVVVTTAGLPWRTGTAVNPLLRALYLTRGRPKDHVTLMIPWLNDKESRIKLYGDNGPFESPKEQEEWIRTYCRERANCVAEETNLRIQFYLAAYHAAFGSIFPSVDICALIPADEADIAILEEPEHLNWFRVPHAVEQENLVLSPSSSTQQKQQTNLEETKQAENEEDEALREMEELGWAHKFRHVVGVLHTNYSAYVEQYGMFSTSFVTGRAINALSSLVVRAYCHKIIRLSNTLPSLAPRKEITSNIHGVRDEFLVPNKNNNNNTATVDKQYAPVYFIGKLMWAKGFDNVLELQEVFRQKSPDNQYFPMDIYGGGPDQVQIQRAFFGRPDKNANNNNNNNNADNRETNDNVAVEVFQWEDSLRSHLISSSPEQDNNRQIVETTNTTTDPTATFGISPLVAQGGENTPDKDDNAFITTTTNNANNNNSIVLNGNQTNNIHNNNSNNNNGGGPISILGDMSIVTLNTGFATTHATFRLAERVVQTGMKMTFSTSSNSSVGSISSSSEASHSDNESKEEEKIDDNNNNGGGGGLLKLLRRNSSNISNSSDNKGRQHPPGMEDNQRSRRRRNGGRLKFDPFRSRFEWRRRPLPANFKGSKDHIELRDIPQTKIFLNMSITEVLCTTTAEAIAMGKFVIIPQHPSNEFFYQFPNCLTYTSLEECYEKLQWALNNNPEPLGSQHRYLLSWEGATERLLQAAIITQKEMDIYRLCGNKKNDKHAAKFHIESGKKGQFLGKVLFGI